mgnify:CR=1 FL=1|jgi:lysozyme
MTDRERTRQLITRHEGRRARMYLDSLGNETIGVGRNLKARGLSADEIDLLLTNDLDHAEKDAITWAGPVWLYLSPVRRHVIVDMAFNMGLPRLRGFKRFRAAVRRQDWESAAAEMIDSRWYVQVKGRAKTLVKMMRTGEWP